jgi:beta-lactamase class A
VLVAAAAVLLATELVPQPAEAARRKRRRAASTAVATPPASDALRDTTLQALAEVVERIATEAGGTAGVAILHLESGERYVRHGDDRFPMASVYKVPIAIRLLQRVDAGEISLADTVFLRVSDMRTGSGRIAARHPRGGWIALYDLLDAMLVDSDNTASDFLLRVAGGPGAVTACMRDLGVRDVRVDRSEIQMAFDYSGIASPPPDSTWTPAVLSALWNNAPYAIRKRTAVEFLDDPRDTTTPNAMVGLLSLVWAGETSSAASTTLLLDAMERCATGPGRIPGLLPRGTRTAHKTGTWSSTDGVTAAVNDVGIVSLPNNRGHVAIVVLVKGSRRSNGRIERCIARVARAAYNRWVPAAEAAALEPAAVSSQAAAIEQGDGKRVVKVAPPEGPAAPATEIPPIELSPMPPVDESPLPPLPEPAPMPPAEPAPTAPADSSSSAPPPPFDAMSGAHR